MDATRTTTYAIVNAKGEKYWFDRGFFAELPWHMGHPDKDGWLTDVLNAIKSEDPEGDYKIVEHYKTL